MSNFRLDDMADVIMDICTEFILVMEMVPVIT